MRKITLVLLATTLVAAPAAAQQNVEAPAMEPAPANTAADTSVGTNAPMNGLAADPVQTGAEPVPPTAEAPGVTDATVTPDMNEGGGFPWGILGLLGLLGLINRSRSKRADVTP